MAKDSYPNEPMFDDKDKQLLQQGLCDDIEILLEEFEEDTGNQVFEIKVSRVEVDEKKCHKAFEYLVGIRCLQ